jgi:hypothetical protein
MPTDGLPGERETAVALIRSGADVAAPTVVFRTCINDGVVAFADARACLEALRPARAIVEAVDAFQHAELRSGPWIGLHVRHGNGGNIMGHASSWLSPQAAMGRCRRAVERVRQRIGATAKVFLCTDSIAIETELRNTIPGVVCRPKSFRPLGQGELHLGAGAAARLDDALVEMLLLARCHALIRYPAGSFFSFYAAVMKPALDPHPATIDDLLAASDPQDRLSPAILF